MSVPHSGRTAKKRPEDRTGHRTRAELASVTQIPVSQEAAPPTIPAPDANWCQAAQQVWSAFVSSPVAYLWESTDYAQAWVTCGAIDSCVSKGYSATQLMTVRGLMNDLMLTEAARRSADIAITRTPVQEDPAKVRAMDVARSRKHAD